ncbi:MAG: hypothetical protein NTY48_02375, partial [Candidatus Diapherotrites archaeon]|nr:hypothetical protein [Candidatus Diapherotrites archaeon]
MMNKKKLLINGIVIILVVAAIITGINPNTQNALFGMQKDDTITIVWEGPLTGDAANWGTESK